MRSRVFALATALAVLSIPGLAFAAVSAPTIKADSTALMFKVAPQEKQQVQAFEQAGTPLRAQVSNQLAMKTEGTATFMVATTPTSADNVEQSAILNRQTRLEGAQAMAQTAYFYHDTAGQQASSVISNNDVAQMRNDKPRAMTVRE